MSAFTTLKALTVWLEARFLFAGVKTALTEFAPMCRAAGRLTPLALPPFTAAVTVLPP